MLQPGTPPSRSQRLREPRPSVRIGQCAVTAALCDDWGGDVGSVEALGRMRWESTNCGSAKTIADARVEVWGLDHLNLLLSYHTRVVYVNTYLASLGHKSMVNEGDLRELS